MLIPIGIVGLGGNNWITILSTSGIARGIKLTLDSNKNVYINGFESIGGIPKWQIAKFNNDGLLQWQRSLAASGAGYGVALDSSSNVYLSGNGDGAIQIAKYNSSGSIQWQRKLDDATVQFTVDMSADSSGNSYVSGYDDTANVILAKYNTSGSLVWQRKLSSTGQAGNSAKDASDNILLTANLPSTSNTGIIKYNSSGGIVWQRSLNYTFNNGIATDSSSNVYAIGSDFEVVKYNSSGTLQWQKRLITTDSSLRSYAVCADNSGNVYVAGGERLGSTDGSIQIVKYNSSGTLLWQRSLTTSAGGFHTVLGITVDNDKSFYITGLSSDKIIIAKLADDGASTGSYALDGKTYIYAASSGTDSTLSYTSSTTSRTDSAHNLTSSTTTYTDAATSLTQSTVSF